MYDMSNDQVTDLIEADLGPGAHGYFTTRGLRARPVPAGSVDVTQPQGSGADPVSSGGEGGDYRRVEPGASCRGRPQRVHHHRRRLEELLNLEPGQHLAWMNQVHSAVVAEAPGRVCAHPRTHSSWIPECPAPPQAAAFLWPTAFPSCWPPGTVR